MTYSIQSGTGAPGSTVSLGIGIAGDGQPSALQWTLNYSAADLSVASVTAGPAATAAGKNVYCSNAPGSLVCLVAGMNMTAITDGVAALVSIQIASDTTSVTTPLQLTGVVAAASDGTSIPSGGSSGMVTIAQPTQMFTLTALVSPANAGVVTALPSPTSGAYAAGTYVCLTATPNAGWTFNSWSGAALNSSNCLTISANTTVTANFVSAELSLDQQKLLFGATNNGAIVTPAQTVHVAASSGLSWTASSNQSYVVVSPTAGTGNGSFTVSIQSTTLPSPANLSATVTVTAPAASNSPQSVQVSLNVMNAGSTGLPFGSFDTPSNDATGIAGSVAVTGWALDTIEVQSVQIWRDPVGSEPVASNGLVYIGDATFVSGARPDVQSAYPDYPLNDRAGWGYLMLTNGLPNNGGAAGTGNGMYTLHAIATSLDGNATDLGTKTITCNNTDSTIPFGTIDTPLQGATVSGTIVNFGWALTPLPDSIPTDGSTITVYVDNQPLGHPVYNQYRADIATGFPGYANSNGAIGYFYLDTTTLSNGLHTIGWSVTDNNGRAAGIGSRFFWVLN